jgi:L-threonylcarbamoyladenylate synthase
LKTQYLATSEGDLAIAAELLQRGELVVFPTETVYGLGADALNKNAVAKIYQAKGRPSDNPLIVHVSGIAEVSRVAVGIDPLALQLMERFWPGPLTLVLPKRSNVPDSVTAGLETVAVRFPNHGVACELIRRAARPLAAPSANRSGRPSATTWQAAAEDLDGRVAAIVCGEPTGLGLESTVVDGTDHIPLILRPGGITLEALKAFAPNIIPYSGLGSGQSQTPSDAHRNSPGLRHQHYQPRAKVIVLESITLLQHDTAAIPPQSALQLKASHFIGCTSPEPGLFRKVIVCDDVKEYAAKLFDCFRNADADAAVAIYCESVPEDGLGVALMDRLRRASNSSDNNVHS